MTYKTLDERFGRVVAAVALWFLAAFVDSWVLLLHSPVLNPWVNLTVLGFALGSSALVVAVRFQIYRTLEVRSDCLILDNDQVFFRERMEGAWPTFRNRSDGALVLSGTYGTRHVNYLTTWHFDPYDRGPEVFANHVQYAMTQLWTKFY